jgi:putative ABC transport system permease protein
MQTTRLAARSLWTHKRRLVGAFIAVILGVAFLAGTLIVSDTLAASIDHLFVQAFSGTDVSVRNANAVSKSSGTPRGGIDVALLLRVAAVPGVAAEPVIQGTGQLLDRTGRVISVQGPQDAGNWIALPALNPFHIVAGHAPRPTHRGYPEVVVDRQVANQGHLHVGDTTGLLVPQRIEVRIVGIATFGSADAYGDGSYTAFTLADAQRYIAQSPHTITSIAVQARPGFSPDALRAAIQAVLPRGIEAVTGQTLVQESISNTGRKFITLFRTFLVSFAVIALIVSIFSIYNTFAILAAQNARASALLRLVGASRRQVLAMVVMEGIAVALIASLAGLGVGLGLAALLGQVFRSGFGIPITGLVVAPAASPIAVAAGVGATLLAGLVPAIRGSRIPPLAALRAATSDTTDISATATNAGCLLVIGGTILVVAGATLAGQGAALLLVGLGALATLIGLVTLGPALARPVSALLGVPGTKLRGAPGRLARGNAMREPRRTARAGTALMLGVAVVTLFTVLAASLRAGQDSSISQSLTTNLVVSSGSDQFGGYSPRLPATLARLPQVAETTGFGTGTVLIDGSRARISVADPSRIPRFLRLNVRSGSLPTLRTDQLAVSTAAAQSNHWHIGTGVSVTYDDGTTQRFTIHAIYGYDPTLLDYLMPAAAWTAHTTQATDYLTLVKLKPGVGLAAAKTAIARAALPFGMPAVQTVPEYIGSQGASLTTLLDVAYGMLAVAIVIALLGIGNTLSLSMYERTRELGLLRAVGATRAQVRTMVRWESLIVALFGTLSGMILGLFSGWGLVEAIGKYGPSQFAVPTVQLAIIVVVGGVAGVLAAIRPANRAARLNVLRAVAYE